MPSQIEGFNVIQTDSAISAAEIRQTVARLVQSRYFSHAPKKQKFVRVITEYHLQGRAAELNEYLIGCEVFDKGADYHPSSDPVVRVAAHDVRKKLEAYYTHEGAQDAVRLIVPVGSYVPVFSRQTVTPVSSVDVAAALPSLGASLAPSPISVTTTARRPAVSLVARLLPLVTEAFRDWMERRFKHRANPLLLGACLVVLSLIAVGVWLMVGNRTLQSAFSSAPSSSTAQKTSAGIWAPFLANQAATLLILSNPVVYRTAHSTDPVVITQKAIRLSGDQALLLGSLSDNRLPIQNDQPMQLIPAFNMYTGVGEAIGAYRLHGLLLGYGEPSLLKQSRNVGIDDLKAHDVILLGSIYANQWAKPLSLKENFVFTQRASIENTAPQAGEQREYIPAFDQRTGSLLEDYALISVVPGVSGTTAVMSLAGIYSEGTQAATEYVTDNAKQAELLQRLQEIPGAKTPSPYFQALLKVHVENAFPTQTTLLHVRALR